MKITQRKFVIVFEGKGSELRKLTPEKAASLLLMEGIHPDKWMLMPDVQDNFGSGKFRIMQLKPQGFDVRDLKPKERRGIKRNNYKSLTEMPTAPNCT